MELNDQLPDELSRALEATPSGERARIDYDAGRLAGSRCTRCSAVSWPPRPVCQRCGSAAVESLLLSGEGTLGTYTVVWVPRPGVTPPYILGQVDLADGVRVFAHGRGVPEGAQVPLPVRIVVDDDRDAVPPFWFQPMETP